MEQLYPVTPLEDLEAIVSETPPWFTVHGGLIIDRLKDYLIKSGGERSWSDIKREQKNGIAPK